MTTPTITLKNVKVAQFASQETTCFQATVYVDGKALCIAHNEGCGGPDCYAPIKREPGAQTALDTRISELGAQLNPNAVERWEDVPKNPDGSVVDAIAFDDENWHLHTKSITRLQVFEGAVARALDDHMIAKDLKRSFRTHILAKLTDGRILQWKLRKGADQARAIAQIMEHQEKKGAPVATVLNLVSMERAVEIMRTVGA